jgi:hypothetical protein
MTETRFSGPATPEELLAYIIRLARDTGQSQTDSQLVRQEVRTALATFVTENASIAKQTKQIQDSYAPASVQKAVEAAETVLASFEGESKNVIEQLKKWSAWIFWTLLMRTVLWAVITSLCLAFVAWLAIPNIAVIADRRAELKGLQDQITATKTQVEGLKDRLLFVSGHWYVKYDRTVTICLDQSRPETCGPYVLVY